MECAPIPRKSATLGAPQNWVVSARAIEGYCLRLLRAGYPATLFLDPLCAAEHTPMLEELQSMRVELGLAVHPPALIDGRYARPLVAYDAESQRAMISHASEQFADAIGRIPRSFRGGRFSASVETYSVLASLGFRQSSLSRPGWDAAGLGSFWANAPVDAHNPVPDAAFLELPLTTDGQASQARKLPIELTIEMGTFDALHWPLIEQTLDRFAREDTSFCSLCISTSNMHDYYTDTQHAQTLEALIERLGVLAGERELVPVTLSSAHEYYRRARAESPEAA